jgi:hypothetical protein
MRVPLRRASKAREGIILYRIRLPWMVEVPAIVGNNRRPTDEQRRWRECSGTRMDGLF